MLGFVGARFGAGVAHTPSLGADCQRCPRGRSRASSALWFRDLRVPHRCVICYVASGVHARTWRFRFCECFVGGQVVCLWTVRGRLRVYVGPFHNNIGESATVKPYTAVLRGWRRGFTASTGVLRGSSIRLSVEICCRGGRVERHSTGLTRACLRGRLLPPMWVTLTVRTMYVR